MTLYWIIGTQVVEVDLRSAELDQSHVETGLGAINAPIEGIAVSDKIIAVSARDALLHIFQTRAPGGPVPSNHDGGRDLHAALDSEHLVVLSLSSYYYPGTKEYRIYDISDPESPILSRWNGELELDYSHCAVNQNWAAIIGQELDLINIPSWPNAYRLFPTIDMDFVGPNLAAVVDTEGLHIYDLRDGTFDLRLAHISMDSLNNVSVMTGGLNDPPTIATHRGASTISIWDLRDPTTPQLRAELTANSNGLVDIRGGLPRLFGIARLGDDDWPGASMRLVVETDNGLFALSDEIRLPGEPFEGWLEGNALHLACESAGLIIVDVSNPLEPFIKGGFGCPPIHSVQLDEGVLLLGGESVYAVAPDVAVAIEDDPSDDDIPPEIPAKLRLAPAAPNPFNPRVTLTYEVPRRGEIALRISDLRGRLVRLLVNEVHTPGRYQLDWDGCDAAGRPMPSGSYLVSLESNYRIAAQKITLVR
jgi:hypothetical protein